MKEDKKMADENTTLDEISEEAKEESKNDALESNATESTVEEGDEKGEKAEFEIIRETGDSQSPKQQHFGIRKRINKLNARNEAANQRADQANTDNAILQEKNKILEIALQQARESQSTTQQPKVGDFDEGFADPKFQEKQNEYNQSIIQNEVRRQVAESTKHVTDNSSTQFQSQELERKQLKHYERAADIGAKDYADTEDKAIEALGNEIVNHMITNFPDSQYLLYYLGKNTHEAERIAGLIHSNPIQGIAEIGRLSSELKVKTKTSTTPNPDDEIEGGEPAATGSLQRQLDKLRDQAAKNPSTESMKKVLNFKKRLKEKNINLE